MDAVVSNRAINLSPDNGKAFQEAYRALKPGGRLTVSDVISEGSLPDAVKNGSNSWACCISGALEQEEYLRKIR